MNYRDLYITCWHNSTPRPPFQQSVYFFEYDGTSYAYKTEGGIWSFLSWVVGIINETTTEVQDDDEPDDHFLDRAGVSYGYWGATL
tara:strand:+ start:583 stop:840 length:258 start_codon:yes stop_codon:yes gene_type:complete